MVYPPTIAIIENSQNYLSYLFLFIVLKMHKSSFYVAARGTFSINYSRAGTALQLTTN